MVCGVCGSPSEADCAQINQKEYDYMDIFGLFDGNIQQRQHINLDCTCIAAT